jgi:hypothetical protein
MKVSGQLHAPVTLLLGKSPGSHGMEAGYVPEPVWR